jgi:hypothetical protein
MVVAHDARMRIILVFWPFGRGYEPRLNNSGRSPTYITLPDHAKPAQLCAIRALPPAWLTSSLLSLSKRSTFTQVPCLF